jgi:hypothetical protein
MACIRRRFHVCEYLATIFGSFQPPSFTKVFWEAPLMSSRLAQVCLRPSGVTPERLARLHALLKALLKLFSCRQGPYFLFPRVTKSQCLGI